MLKTSVLEFPGGNVLNEYPFFSYEMADELPDVPALPETLLTMEFQLQENSVDLANFSEAVLGDLGATVQILRLAGREYEFAEDCPTRIEDYISDLGLTACFNAVSKATLTRSSQQRANFEMWTHSREVARHFRALTEEVPGAVSPDQAYIAGLLHAIGALPEVLGWHWSETSSNHALSALKLAERWRLPGYVKDFFCETVMPGYNTHWSELLATAHHLARSSRARCPLKEVQARSFAQSAAN